MAWLRFWAVSSVKASSTRSVRVTQVLRNLVGGGSEAGEVRKGIPTHHPRFARVEENRTGDRALHGFTISACQSPNMDSPEPERTARLPEASTSSRILIRHPNRSAIRLHGNLLDPPDGHPPELHRIPLHELADLQEESLHLLGAPAEAGILKPEGPEDRSRLPSHDDQTDHDFFSACHPAPSRSSGFPSMNPLTTGSWTGLDLLRGSHEPDHSLIEHPDSVGDPVRALHVVRDHQRR